MESFGAYLKSLREEKGKSLHDIADSTKIAVSNLEFLESDRFDLLPPRVFVKGFVRSYVQELELSPEEALKKFDQFTREGELPDYAEEEHPVFQHQSPSASLITSKWFTVILSLAGVLSLCVLLLTGITRLFFPENRSEAVAPKVSTVQPLRTTEDPSGTEVNMTKGPVSETSKPRAQAGTKVLRIKALANAWIRVEPDTGPAQESMMAPGDVQEFTARETFHLQTGNAGGITLWYDGRQYPTLGKTNQTLSLTVP